MNDEKRNKLILEFQNGDYRAFEKIYKTTYSKAYSIAILLVKDKYIAEDLVQDSYIKILRSISSLKNVNRFDSWFNTIVTNTCKDYLVKKRTVLFSELESCDIDEDFDQKLIDSKSERTLVENIEKAEISSRVRECIYELPDDQRICVMMHYFCEMTVDEIATELGVSRNTVLSRLSYARKKLKKMLQKDKDDDLFAIIIFPIIQYSVDDYDIAKRKILKGQLNNEARKVLKRSSIISTWKQLSLLKRIAVIFSVTAFVATGVALVTYFANSGSNNTNDVITDIVIEDIPRTEQYEGNTIRYGSLFIANDDYVVFSEENSVCLANSDMTEKEIIVSGNAKNYLMFNEHLYFITEDNLYNYNMDSKQIENIYTTTSDLITYSNENYYSIDSKSSNVYLLNENFEETPVTTLPTDTIWLTNNLVCYYDNSGCDLVMQDVDNLQNKTILIEGKNNSKMKFAYQLTDEYCIFPTFDSDSTGELVFYNYKNNTTKAIKLKKPFISFGVCNDRIYYSNTEKGFYSSNINGKRQKHISKSVFNYLCSFGSYMAFYDMDSDATVIFDTVSRKEILKINGIIELFEIKGNTVFYKQHNNYFNREFNL